MEPSLTLAVLALVASLPLSPAVPAADAPPVERDLAPAELVVRMNGPSPHGARSRWIPVDVPPGEDVADALERLALTPGVAHVAYNYRYRLHATPNDPLFGPLQWNLPAIDWPGAWEQGDGSGVVVAILDSGIGLGGEDLACRTFVHPYNAATGVADLGAAADGDGHGTHVTGTVAQCTDNGIGVAGVAPGVSVMPVKVADDYGDIYSGPVANGIAWAVAHGADVINLSLGRSCDLAADWPVCKDPAVDPEIEAAVAAGIVVVASTGNNGLGHVDSPANHPAAIAVGATIPGDRRAAYSNYGPDIDLMAPGGTEAEPIFQETFVGADYDYYGFNGTSMAAPHVSGAAAILKSIVPDATAAEIRSALTSSALDLDAAGWDTRTGFGLIQIDAAIDALLFPCLPGAECDSATLVDASGRWHRWRRLTAG
ncbi:MAG: hypothetical protein EHM57_06490, partial [Actinobacteria bacterium]